MQPNDTQSREECRRVGGQPNILRAARSVGEQEGSQAHSEPPSTLRAGGSVGGEREGSQAHSEPGGVGGQLSTLRARGRGGWEREGSQAHSESVGVV